MTRVRTAVVLTLPLCLLLTACGGDPPPADDPPFPTTFRDEGESVRQRISAHLADNVIPKLGECWTRVGGDGVVALDLHYRKSEAGWSFEKAAVQQSTFDASQHGSAGGCVDEAARGSAFPLDREEPLEAAADVFVARVAVPVPLPPAGEEVGADAMARMVGTGGTMNDIPGCSACVSNPNYPYGLKCEARSSGGHLDCREHSSNVCSTAPTACLRGFFAGSRGVVIY